MVAFRSFARVALFASLFSLVVVGCGRSWLGDIDDTGTDSGSPEAGPPEGGKDGEAGVCGPATCASGCCTPGGVCIAGSTPNACGVGGAICIDCTTKGFPVCDGQTHQCESDVTNCTPASCPTGCCAGNLCISGTSIEDCGNFGNVCQDCVQSGLACQGQQCTQAGCGPENCGGCCFGNQCVDGVEQAACGFEGEQCQNCLASNEMCVPTPAGGGFCEGVVSTCNDSNCPGGCCDANGVCEQGVSSTACGANAVFCQNCLQLGATCQFQECVPSLACNAQTCPGGCCDANGLCETGQSPVACGDFGNLCQNCSSFGASCAGQTCQFVDAGTCDSLTCPNGCCDVNGFCEPGQSQSSCGDFGNACQNCDLLGNMCFGQRCASACSSQTCPDGCCDQFDVCQSGTTNGACGFGGNLCESCSQFGDVCGPSQECQVPPPQCTPTSCPNGCCDANGICEAGFIDTACGQAGAQCADCAASGSSCDTAVSPRVCNSAQMTCPTSFTSCPSSLTPTPTISTTACSDNDLQNGAVACAGGAHTALCQQFMQFEQMNNASCGACLRQFDFDLTEVQGVLACIEPFVADPSCLNTIACLDQCENVSCAMCPSGGTEGCESSVEQGQCSTWTTQIQCTFPEFQGAGSFCDPNNTGNFGSWLETVGQTFCSSQVVVADE